MRELVVCCRRCVFRYLDEDEQPVEFVDEHGNQVYIEDEDEQLGYALATVGH